MSDRDGPYAVRYDPRALKELKRLDPQIARRILRACHGLATEPRPHGVRQPVGYPGLWRVRVGEFRVGYTIQDAELIVLVLRVASRGSLYRRL